MKRTIEFCIHQPFFQHIAPENSHIQAFIHHGKNFHFVFNVGSRLGGILLATDEPLGIKYSKKYMCSIGMGPLHLYCPSHGSKNHFNLNEKSFLTTQAFNDQRLLHAFMSYMWKRAELYGPFSSPYMSSVCLLYVEKP